MLTSITDILEVPYMIRIIVDSASDLQEELLEMVRGKKSTAHYYRYYGREDYGLY
jgi:hypothetical protein